MSYNSIVYLPCLVFFLSSHCSFCFVNAAELSIVTDKEALLSFKSLVSTDPSDLLFSWNNSNSNPCNWTGVYCDEVMQRVSRLDLSGFRLAGYISPYIGNLSFLGFLQLQENHLTGIIPDQIGDLSSLVVLNLSSNSIRGTIPLNITMCLNLRILDLTGNKISGAIPEGLSHLLNLESLKLSQNQLSGKIPTSISNLTSLLTLNLATNELVGMIPGNLGRLQNLRFLDLSINHLTGTVPPSLYNISSLIYFAVASNQLWGEIPSDVGEKLPNLLNFNFCINKFTSSIPGSLHNLTNIQSIRLAHNDLSGSVPPGLENLVELLMYNVGFNQIVSSGNEGLKFITRLTNNTRLRFLAIGDNLLEGVIPDSIGNLSNSLTNLYMGGNYIHGRIPASISHLNNLALLNLSNNYLSGEIPREIGQLVEMQELYLAANKITGSIPNSLGNLRKLSVIDLSANNLVGRIPTTFVGFQKLLWMDLSDNRLNASIPKEVFSLSSLTTLLNLSNNLLSGPLPQEIEALESVVAIDLSNNSLRGSIPYVIGNCKSLEELFMANNMFSGIIPDTVGKVKGLAILDLSLNQLSGTIPRSLQNLHALQLLNLSFNNLEGLVPTDGIFKSLSRVKVEGNPKLCLNLPCDGKGGNKTRSTSVYIFVPITIAIVVCSLLGLSLCVMKKNSKILPTPSLAKIMPTSGLLKVQHKTISYDELRLATGTFSPKNLIGNGSFGSVYKGCLREGTAVAVKVLDMDRERSWNSFSAECEALKNVRHRNIVKLITSCSSIDNKGVEFLALVYEFMSNGSLDDWIEGRRRHSTGEPFGFMERLNVAIDIASAVEYLHHDCKNPVVHCDLKPSNVLLHYNMTAKVGDFGLARLLIDRASGVQSITCSNRLKGSIGYIPPEYGQGVKPTTSGDVYSYGVMLLELFTGKSPTSRDFNGEMNLIKWVQSAFPTHTEQVLDTELLQPLMCQTISIKPGKQLECLISVIGVGLSCTVDSQVERISMRDALHKLKIVRDTLVKPTLISL
ncbi:hypothetical protein Dsin_003159 [Dipteronia sinensis]|uniref:non-specific serine/threonine protein kinase n=1 Tax=Dipteronia sinensis TaxID=43782 RepID=A0AAE0EJZ0_9ROSI|nr:hypothetical protein Dsin_003159 [Dipteronia sinensis]